MLCLSMRSLDIRLFVTVIGPFLELCLSFCFGHILHGSLVKLPLAGELFVRMGLICLLQSQQEESSEGAVWLSALFLDRILRHLGIGGGDTSRDKKYNPRLFSLTSAGEWMFRYEKKKKGCE